MFIKKACQIIDFQKNPLDGPFKSCIEFHLHFHACLLFSSFPVGNGNLSLACARQRDFHLAKYWIQFIVCQSFEVCLIVMETFPSRRFQKFLFNSRPL